MSKINKVRSTLFQHVVFTVLREEIGLSIQDLATQRNRIWFHYTAHWPISPSDAFAFFSTFATDFQRQDPRAFGKARGSLAPSQECSYHPTWSTFPFPKSGSALLESLQRMDPLHEANRKRWRQVPSVQTMVGQYLPQRLARELGRGPRRRSLHGCQDLKKEITNRGDWP